MARAARGETMALMPKLRKMVPMIVAGMRRILEDDRGILIVV